MTVSRTSVLYGTTEFFTPRCMESVSVAEQKMLQRFRQMKAAGVWRVTVENGQPVTLQFVVDSRPEFL